MRILHTESSCGWGGQDIRVLVEVEEMRKRGHDVTLACVPDSPIWNKAKEKQIDAVGINFTGRVSPRTITALRKLIKARKIETVNTHSWTDGWCGAIAARSCGCLSVRSRHLSLPVRPHVGNQLLYLKLVDGVIVTGENLREQLIAVNKIPSERIMSIPTGVAPHYFEEIIMKSGGIRQELNLSSEAFVWTTVAIIRRMKGHSVLVEAAASLRKNYPNAHYLFVGGFNDQEAAPPDLRELVSAKGMNDRIHFLGMRKDVPEILSQSDAFVLASIKSEGVPQSITQAMAGGLPVVATNVGGIPEVVRNSETGYLVEPNQPEALAGAMATVMADSDEAKKRALAGQQLIREEYSLAIMVDKVEAFYQQLLGQKRK